MKKETKRGRGQPRKYNPDELEKASYKYLEHCNEKNLFPNIAGMCTYLKMHKDTFYEYKKHEEYSDHIKRIEEALENACINSSKNSDVFKIFYMKNKFGYKDKTEVDSNINANVSVEDFLKANKPQL